MDPYGQSSAGKEVEAVGARGNPATSEAAAVQAALAAGVHLGTTIPAGTRLITDTFINKESVGAEMARSPELGAVTGPAKEIMLD